MEYVQSETLQENPSYVVTANRLEGDQGGSVVKQV